jgi:hypothetical protein
MLGREKKENIVLRIKLRNKKTAVKLRKSGNYSQTPLRRPPINHAFQNN